MSQDVRRGVVRREVEMTLVEWDEYVNIDEFSPAGKGIYPPFHVGDRHPRFQAPLQPPIDA